MERAAFYGLRSILVLYLIDESIGMDREKAFEIYGFFIGLIVLFKVLGALIGDLFLGNKKAIVFGAILQAIGAFCFCIPNVEMIYVGLGFVIIGGGLYAPNMMASFGVEYQEKPKYVDAGFAIYYLATNIGAFIGVSGILIIAEYYGYKFGFFLSGILFLISLLVFLVTRGFQSKASKVGKEILDEKIYNSKVDKVGFVPQHVFVLGGILILGVFWAVRTLGDSERLVMSAKYASLDPWGIDSSFQSLIDQIFLIPIVIILILLWTYHYSTQISKLLIGFVLGSLSFVLLYLMPEVETEKYFFIFLLAVFFLNLSEIFISPVAHGVIVKYGSRKFQATLLSLSILSPVVISYLINMLRSFESIEMTIVGAMMMGSVGLGLLVGYLRSKRKRVV